MKTEASWWRGPGLIFVPQCPIFLRKSAHVFVLEHEMSRTIIQPLFIRWSSHWHTWTQGAVQPAVWTEGSIVGNRRFFPPRTFILLIRALNWQPSPVMSAPVRRRSLTSGIRSSTFLMSAGQHSTLLPAGGNVFSMHTQVCADSPCAEKHTYSMFLSEQIFKLYRKYNLLVIVTNCIYI